MPSARTGRGHEPAGTFGAGKDDALATFLETHHASDPQVRAALVDYLVGLDKP